MSEPASRARRALPAVLLLLLAVGAYANALQGEFLWDDAAIVRDNPLVQSLDPAAVFRSPYWAGSDGDPYGSYRPLTILSLALNRLLLGSGVAWYRAVNLLLHAGVTLALFSLARALGLAAGTAWAAAALFALHPIHAEAVVLIVGRSELLAALFALLGLRAARAPGRGRVVLVGLCYAAALLCKEHAVTFVLLLPLCDLFLSRQRRRELRRQAPVYLAVAGITAAYLAAGPVPLWRTSGVEAHLRAADNPLVGMAPVPRVLSALKTQGFYLSRLLAPAGLQVSYGRGGFSPVGSVGSPAGLAVLLGVCGVGAALAAGWRRRSAAALGLAFHFAAFAVTSNVLFLVAMLRAERFAYLPSAGFCLALAAVGEQAFHALPPRLPRILAAGAGAGYLVVLGTVTVFRNPDFRSSTALWESVVAVDPQNPYALLFLGKALHEQGRDREADAALQGALRAEPALPEARIGYGVFLLRTGRPGEAVPHLTEGIRLLAAPDPGTVLLLAQAHLAVGDAGRALATLDSLLPLSGTGEESEWWAAVGRVLLEAGRPAAAVSALRHALDLRFDPEVQQALREAERLAEDARTPPPGLGHPYASTPSAPSGRPHE